ncbi:hypothetical protein BD779DRAFT_1806082 [Infundibulicybe gibba]|nr:hypothetical protein BD779DRAFT_1806082 [Infundibulicybe gibba]
MVCPVQTATYTMSTTPLSSHMENLGLDDDEERSNKIRAELERINKTLTLSAMVTNQPYKCLPYQVQYTPNWDIDHRPPVFLYGPGLTFAEIREHIIRVGLPFSTDERSNTLLYEFSGYLDELFGVEKGTVHGIFPSCRGPVVFRVKTNYYCDLSDEKMGEIEVTCERVFQRRPMWYVGSARKRDYRISEPEFFLSVE